MSRTQKLFSIAPHGPFLGVLADRLVDGTLLGGWERGVFGLVDVTVILPTRRARLALARELMRRGERLLPDIRTFGGEAEDEEPFLPPYEAPLLRQPAAPFHRLLTLARLIDAWAHTPDGARVLATPPNAAEVLGLAQSLGGLLDDLTIEAVRVEDVLAVPEENLPENWQQVLRFLGIALEVWPQMLGERGLADPPALRNERLERQAQTAALIYGDRPVIAAGSTGSIPATAGLLQAIAGLPRGALVLPGLDTTLSPEQHERLIDRDGRGCGQAQYALARLLRRLGTTHSDVVELAPAANGARTAAVRHALAPAEDTVGWAAARAELEPGLGAAFAGVTIIAARSEDEEARAIVAAAHAALTAGRTVGIVSPDQGLARRIAGQLRRIGVLVDDAAGVPLQHSSAGRLARLILAAAASGFAPVDLMALLQNGATSLGLPRETVARRSRLMELALLRGQRPMAGVAGLKRLLEAQGTPLVRRTERRLSAEEKAEIADLLERLGTAFGPLSALLEGGRFTAPDFALKLLETTEAVVAGGDLPGLTELRSWAAALALQAGNGPAIPATGLDAVLATLMAGHKVTSLRPGRDDIAIWGELEARLQNPDLLIMAGLNEEVWPRVADPGPWLSRGMRIAAGLQPPEFQQGQAAHDFEMGMGNGEVILAFAERRGTSPALASRLLQRLEAFLGPAAKALRERGRQWLVLAQRLDLAPGEARAERRPLPSPPVSQRPKKLSVTEAETLFRSPYDIYAKHVLGLRRLPALGDLPDARERGSMIHDVFDRFVREELALDDPNAEARLMQMAEEAFAGLDAIGERRDIWLKRFARAAAQFLEFERRRDATVAERLPEISGAWEMGTGFVLTGKADRIDVLEDGTLEIIDFKTGSIPDRRTMRAFEAPQLLLEARMARAGAFAGVPPAPTSALTYVKIALGPEALTVTPFQPQDGFDLNMAADEVEKRLARHVAALLLDDRLPLAPRIRPDPGRRFRGDYDHLARTDEWTLEAGDEE